LCETNQNNDKSKKFLKEVVGCVELFFGCTATTQCFGLTKAGTRCKNMTRIANGYCFQHQLICFSKKVLLKILALGTVLVFV
jgi:hypothetical protein